MSVNLEFFWAAAVHNKFSSAYQKEQSKKKKWKKRSGKIWKIVGLNEILYFV